MQENETIMDVRCEMKFSHSGKCSASICTSEPLKILTVLYRGHYFGSLDTSLCRKFSRQLNSGINIDNLFYLRLMALSISYALIYTDASGL